MFKTSDLYVAAFLKATGSPVVGTELAGRRTLIRFAGCDDDQKLASLINGDATVNALDFINAVKNLKNLVYP